MDILKSLDRIRQIYLENGNIIKYLREQQGTDANSLADIMISYDFQAGTYIARHKQNSLLEKDYYIHLAKLIDRMGPYTSLLEAGVGEATTLGSVLRELRTKPEQCYGFDLSWSRIKYAGRFLREIGISDVNLFVGDLFHIPMQDNSIDVVYTSHSIEPNGGKEVEALTELYRVARKYLILLEPAYELAGNEARARMQGHGYVTRLLTTAQELGFNIVEYRLFDVSFNPLNPTGVMIIQKDCVGSSTAHPLCCPITKTTITKVRNAYFSEKSFLAYPILDDIPCLLPQNAIIATKFLD